MYEAVGPGEWALMSVYELAEWKNGLAFKNIDFSPDGLPVIKIAELKNGVTSQTARTASEYNPSVYVERGNLLFSWSGNPDTSIDIFRWDGGDGWLNQHIFKVTPGKDVTDEFLFFLLRWLRPRFAEIARNKQTTGLGHVTVADLKQMQVRIPTIEVQNLIVGVVGPIESKIELNRRMNATLEGLARALFRDWFVDFGPVRAKQAGAEPYLPPDPWTLFPARLASNGLPEEWEMTKLADLAHLNPESWSKKTAPASIRYVDLSNTKWGQIDKIEPYLWPDAPSRARRVLRSGDTIVGTVRPANGSFAYISEEGLTGSTGFAALRPKKVRDRPLIWCAATSSDNIDRLAHLADGAAYPAVRPDAVAATEIALPASQLLEKFSDTIGASLMRIQTNERESHTLAKTRDLLLPRLMSGELRVRDAESLAGAAL